MKLEHPLTILDALDAIDTYITVIITKTIAIQSSSLEPPPLSVTVAVFMDMLCLTAEKQCALGAKIRPFHRKLPRPWVNTFESRIFEASEGSVTISSLTRTILFLLCTITS